MSILVNTYKNESNNVDIGEEGPHISRVEMKINVYNYLS